MLAIAALASSARAQIAFEDATGTAQISHAGPSFGASWGDFDGDPWPDLWVGNHYTTPALYRNLGTGSFEDLASTVWPGPVRDAHTAAWADFDRDGDQDLIETVGGANPNFLFVNEAGVFVDRAALLGADLPGARSRAPLWFDWNNDGWLDLMLWNAAQIGLQSRLLTYRDGLFEDDTGINGFAELASNYAQLGDLTLDGRVDVLTHSLEIPGVVYDSAGLPAQFVDVGPTLGFPGPDAGAAVDTALADIDGDLQIDVVSARNGGSREVRLVSPTELRVRLYAVAGENRFTFETDGVLSTTVFPLFATTPASLIRLGASGVSVGSYSLVLDPTDPDVQGFPSFDPGVDEGLYFGFESGTPGQWTISLSTPNARVVQFALTSTSTISNVQTIGFPPAPTPPMPNLLLQTQTGFVESRVAAQLDVPAPCNSLAVADFDNDMDLDIYMACTTLVANSPNLLFENLGAGVFDLVASAGGAEGSTQGRADAVNAADYDLDGYVDLFVTNGDGGFPFNDGPDQLFRNLGGTNHWIEIDLRGTRSNADGIGARVEVEAGGVVQIREQSGGMHRWGQHHQRLHWGLGANALVDRITVHWPSGQVQTLLDTPADQILSITETIPVPGFSLWGRLILLALLIALGKGRAAPSGVGRRNAA